MRTLFRFAALLMLAFFALSLLGGGALLHHGLLGHDGLRVVVDGDEVFDTDMLDGFGTLLGLGIAALVVCVVLPVVLLFSIGLPLLIVGCVVAALVGAGAIVFSPVLLFVLLMVLLLRRKNKPRPAGRRNGPNIQA